MYLKNVQIKNYRLFNNISLDFEKDITILAGPNNSGKTSLINLLKGIFNDRQINYKYSDIPIEELNRWGNKFIELLKENHDTNKSINENIVKIENKIFDADTISEDYALNTLTALIEVAYNAEKNDDISEFSDYSMDLDENNHSFYFKYSLSLSKIKFLKDLEMNYEKIVEYNDYIKNPDNKDIEIKKYLLKERLLKIYCSNLTEKCYYCNSEFSNFNNIEDMSAFKKLFIFKNVDALRRLDDNENDNSKSISKRLLRLLKFDEEWIKNTKDLPEKIQDLLTDSNIKAIIQEASKKTLTKTLNDISKTSGGNIDNMQLEMAIDIEDIDAFINKIIQAKYDIDGVLLSEESQGLGYSNLIFMQLQLEEYVKSIDNTKVNIFAIEEPEAHMHPQMQNILIKYLHKYYKEKNFQGFITTHSNEIVKTIGLQNIRVLRQTDSYKSELFDMKRFKHKITSKNVQMPDDENERLLESFYDYFFEIGYSELIFADKSILYEGDTERLYIRKLLSTQTFESLNNNYIAYVQVGGAYAINYKEILDELKIKSLIITDIDYDKKAKSFEDAKASHSTNATLNAFYKLDRQADDNPIISELYNWQDSKDELLTCNLIGITFQNKESTARTLEEAMFAKLLQKNVFEKINRSEWLEKRKHYGLTFTIPNNKENESDSSFSIRDIVDSLKSNKTDFMYSVILNGKEEEMLPEYLEKGLLWLVK